MSAVKVKLQQLNERYQLVVNGQPFYIKGAGLEWGNIKSLADFGGNAFRTWRVDNGKQSALEILDCAQEHGLMVCMGLDVARERHGFDYDDAQMVAQQKALIEEDVQNLKDHPALLMWGIGNELNLRHKNPKVWNAVNELSKMIHREDPNHPTTTMLAGAEPEVISLVAEKCPDLDLLSFQIYGAIDKLPRFVQESNYQGAYMITEWGPNGHWESPNTKWNVPIEQTSTEKARSYRERYEMIFVDSTNCFGSYVFLWGFKQETTSSWYGLFLKDGTQTSVMDVLIEKWSGQKPTNLAPDINAFTINSLDAYQSVKVDKRSIMEVNIDAFDPNDDKLSYHIEIVPESTDTKAGGDFEKAPTAVFQKVFLNSEFRVKAPSKSGKYRLFVVIKDGEKGATANIPFLVN